MWYADISALQTPGTYYVYDAENRVRSYGFRVAEDVYLPVLKAAVRAFFYQRCGGDVPEANGGTWHHPACHLAAGQDRAAQLYIDGQAKGQPRDVHGGWHDAGDYNKYVPFTADVVIPLLMAYELNPAAFGDDWNIPESGNGIPDILDEVRWECDWLLRMQMPDGSVCNRVTERTSKTGVTPDQDNQHERYYTQPTSWATATLRRGPGLFLAGDRASFRVRPRMPARCRAAAERAWAWLEQHPEMTPADGKDHGRPSEAADAACDNGKAGDIERRVMAAVAVVDAGPAAEVRSLLQEVAQGHARALLHRVRPVRPRRTRPWPARSARPWRSSCDDMVIGPYKSQADAYRSYLPGYWWGCNQTKSEYGYRAMFAVKLGVESGRRRAAAAPPRRTICITCTGAIRSAWCYLTNMGPKGANAGAGKSIMRPFHTWFSEKSPWSGPDSLGPAPGLLAGGPERLRGARRGSCRRASSRPRSRSGTGPACGTRRTRRRRIPGRSPSRPFTTRPATCCCSRSSSGSERPPASYVSFFCLAQAFMPGIAAFLRRFSDFAVPPP